MNGQQVSACDLSAWRNSRGQPSLAQQTRVAIEEGRSPRMSVPQALRQAWVICAIEVHPSAQPAPMRGDNIEQLPFFQPAAEDFQHVDAFVPAPSYGPSEQW